MWFHTSDDVRLYGIEAGTAPTAVVLAHEDGEDLCGSLPIIKTLVGAGISRSRSTSADTGSPTSSPETPASSWAETSRLPSPESDLTARDGCSCWALRWAGRRWCRTAPASASTAWSAVGNATVDGVRGQRSRGHTEPVGAVAVHRHARGSASPTCGGPLRVPLRRLARQADRSEPPARRTVGPGRGRAARVTHPLADPRLDRGAIDAWRQTSRGRGPEAAGQAGRSGSGRGGSTPVHGDACSRSDRRRRSRPAAGASGASARPRAGSGRPACEARS
jgi:hypothetical protein